jgi:hypothetical protein
MSGKRDKAASVDIETAIAAVLTRATAELAECAQALARIEITLQFIASATVAKNSYVLRSLVRAAAFRALRRAPLWLAVGILAVGWLLERSS